MKLLLYCTKAKPYIMKYKDGKYKEIASFYNKQDLATYDLLNGKIVAECDYEVKWESTDWGCITFKERQGLEKSCLTKEQLFDYVKGRNEFYAINIKNLHIFDKPKELNEYYSDLQRIVEIPAPRIKKAPQNMMYAFDDDMMIYGLISIKPEWLCKILNGEKTIEVRKKVLKEMIK